MPDPSVFIPMCGLGYVLFVFLAGTFDPFPPSQPVPHTWMVRRRQRSLGLIVWAVTSLSPLVLLFVPQTGLRAQLSVSLIAALLVLVPVLLVRSLVYFVRHTRDHSENRRSVAAQSARQRKAVDVRGAPQSLAPDVENRRTPAPTRSDAMRRPARQPGSANVAIVDQRTSLPSQAPTVQPAAAERASPPPTSLHLRSAGSTLAPLAEARLLSASQELDSIDALDETRAMLDGDMYEELVRIDEVIDSHDLSGPDLHETDSDNKPVLTAELDERTPSSVARHAGQARRLTNKPAEDRSVSKSAAARLQSHAHELVPSRPNGSTLVARTQGGELAELKEMREHVASLQRLVIAQKAAIDQERQARLRYMLGLRTVLDERKQMTKRLNQEISDRRAGDARSRRATEALVDAMAMLSGVSAATDDQEHPEPVSQCDDVRENPSGVPRCRSDDEPGTTATTERVDEHDPERRETDLQPS